MKYLSIFLLLLSFTSMAQKPTFEKGIPNDLDREKIIFIEHEEIPITADPKSGREGKYLHLRQSNHNKVINQSNNKLKTAALSYKADYAIANPSTYRALTSAGYKYVLWSSVYKYEHLQSQPEKDELVIFEYYIYDVENNIAYKVFEMDEMKVYDFKLVIKRLNKAIKSKKS